MANMDKFVFLDIETDGLDATKIHEVVTYSRTDGYIRWRNSFKELKDYLNQATHLVGHNILYFDLPILEKLLDWKKPYNTYVLDTLQLSRYIYKNIGALDLHVKMPSKLKGKHSLKSWGYRLKVYKGDFSETTDWKEWSPEMSEYCEQDVRVTVSIWQHLSQQLKSKYNWSLETLQREAKVMEIIAKQVHHGFYFDRDKAEKAYLELLERKEILEEPFKEVYWDDVVGVYKRDNKTKGIKAGDPKIKRTYFNLGSRQQVARYLKDKYQWESPKKTEKGNPVLNSEVLEQFAKAHPEAKDIIEYFDLIKEIAFLTDWLKVVRQDRRIHGEVHTLGATTRRMTHSKPNLAQIPSGKSVYGELSRSLFTVPEGYKLVGCDASGLELRCLAHYMDDDAYTHAVLNGKKEEGTDIHTLNQKAAGLDTRDRAKTFIYALNYGSGDENLGRVMGKSKQEASKIRKKFLKNTPKLKKLIEKAKKQAKEKGYVQTIDESYIPISSTHKALNFLLQSTGAIAMKESLVILDRWLHEKGYESGKDYSFVANVHDEFQIEVKEELAEEVAELARKSIQQAGKNLKFKCALDGESAIGNNWWETH